MVKRRRHKRVARAPRAGGARRGRPFVHQESWSKVSVILFDRQVARLDRIVHDIRRKAGPAVNRACIIRAMIDALLESPLALGSAHSEAEFRSVIAGRLSARN